jgi:hydrogenase expression/formation protein HypD
VKYIDEYRDKEIVLMLSEQIKSISTKPIVLMEVCGGHHVDPKFGLPTLLRQLFNWFQSRVVRFAYRQKIH